MSKKPTPPFVQKTSLGKTLLQSHEIEPSARNAAGKILSGQEKNTGSGECRQEKNVTKPSQVYSELGEELFPRLSPG